MQNEINHNFLTDEEQQILQDLFEDHGADCDRWFDDYTCEKCQLMEKMFPELYAHFTEILTRETSELDLMIYDKIIDELKEEN